jgi:hypothetical protein
VNIKAVAAPALWRDQAAAGLARRRFAAAERPALAGDVDKSLSKLGWREFCRASVEPGTTYPGPIIDHRAGRERALEADAKVRAM